MDTLIIYLLVVWNIFYMSIEWNNGIMWYNIILVGGLEHLDFFPYIGNVIIPTDELHHFSEG